MGNGANGVGQPAAAGDLRFRDLVDAASAGDGRALEEGVARLVAAMTLEEKVDQMSGRMPLRDMLVMAVHYNAKPFLAGENPRLGVPPISFTDGPRGVALGNSTCFPVSMARGATWDPVLEERIADAMGVEARSQGANFSGAVCINVPRHPGWGRAQETFGEDPYLLGVMGAAMTRGLQRHVMACVKHYACNSIEEARFFVDVHVGERTLREVYLPHFKVCVDAGAAAVMSAYNKVNGEYCGENRHLLRDILKGEWDFGGLVMSDFILGVRNGAAGANAGLDVEMPHRWRYGRRLVKAVRRGDVSESVVDEAAGRIVKQKARFALVGEPHRYDMQQVAGREHAALALECAAKSLVLLKNDGDALPLDRDRVKRIAVLGPLAGKANLGDRGSSRVRPPYAVTPLEGIERAAGAVQVTHYGGRRLSQVRSMVRGADAVVVVAGLTGKDEGEAMPVVKLGGDREDLRLRPRDERLILAAAAESKRCIVVLEGGSAITMGAWLDEVEAVMMAWYPGMEGGRAIGAALFGDANPCGKLPITFAASTDQLPHFDRKARTIDYGYYHGYRLFDRDGMTPAFPFGFGLGYAGFRYSELRLDDGSIGVDGTLVVRADVSNTGRVAGEEIAQLYIGFPEGGVDRPAKELKGFARAALAPGETKTLSFTVRAAELAYYDEPAAAWVVQRGEYEAMVGGSSRQEDLALHATFTVA